MYQILIFFKSAVTCQGHDATCADILNNNFTLYFQ